MAWALPKYSKQDVNRAGRVLVRELYVDYDPANPWGDPFDSKRFHQWVWASDVVGNWRSSHAYPLNTFQVNLRKSAQRVDRSALVAQRTKRFTSIAGKLNRLPKMKLTQMQDIGGCRAVVKSVEGVNKLADFYQNVSRIKHELATCDDYIAHPQASGYRGVHLVYRYFSDKKGPTTAYNGLKIEMQLRSQFQHSWATAVETVGTFIRQALKSSLGEDDWLRFFALMGTAIAHREKTAPVPNTPSSRKEWMTELDHFSQHLNVENRLKAYSTALKQIEDGPANAHYWLLQLDPSIPQLKVTGFAFDEIAEAERQYGEAEKYVKDHPGTDAVLVAVDSIASLQRVACTRFRRHRVRCFHGTGGASWRGGSSRESSSLRLCA